MMRAEVPYMYIYVYIKKKTYISIHIYIYIYRARLELLRDDDARGGAIHVYISGCPLAPPARTHTRARTHARAHARARTHTHTHARGLTRPGRVAAEN